MNEYETFEDELRKARPAQPPAELKRRLRAAGAGFQRVECRDRSPTWPELWQLLRHCLLPASAVMIIGVVLWQVRVGKTSGAGPALPAATAASSLKADDVEFESQLVSTFDAVARLPGGEPVRFQCREWVDQVTWEDRRQGVVVERRTPRFEVVPVRFETY